MMMTSITDTGHVRGESTQAITTTINLARHKRKYAKLTARKIKCAQPSAQNWLTHSPVMCVCIVYDCHIVRSYSTQYSAEQV